MRRRRGIPRKRLRIIWPPTIRRLDVLEIARWYHLPAWVLTDAFRRNWGIDP